MLAWQEEEQREKKTQRFPVLRKYQRYVFWVLMSLCVFMFYSRAMQKKLDALEELQQTICGLEQKKQQVLEEREDLVLQLQSQEDDDWVEMVLKKRLGVVPKGQVKIYFKKEE